MHPTPPQFQDKTLPTSDPQMHPRRRSVLDDHIMRAMLRPRLLATNDNETHNDTHLSTTEPTNSKLVDDNDPAADVVIDPVERERLERMYVMLRWSKRYSRAARDNANQRWEAALAHDQPSTPANTNLNAIPSPTDPTYSNPSSSISNEAQSHDETGLSRTSGGLLDLGEIAAALDSCPPIATTTTTDINPESTLSTPSSFSSSPAPQPPLLRSNAMVSLDQTTPTTTTTTSLRRPPHPHVIPSTSASNATFTGSNTPLSATSARPPLIPHALVAPAAEDYIALSASSSSSSDTSNIQQRNNTGNNNSSSSSNSINCNVDVDDNATDDGTLTGNSSALSSKRGSVTSMSLPIFLGKQPSLHQQQQQQQQSSRYSPSKSGPNGEPMLTSCLRSSSSSLLTRTNNSGSNNESNAFNNPIQRQVSGMCQGNNSRFRVSFANLVTTIPIPANGDDYDYVDDGKEDVEINASDFDNVTDEYVNNDNETDNNSRFLNKEEIDDAILSSDGADSQELVVDSPISKQKLIRKGTYFTRLRGSTDDDDDDDNDDVDDGEDDDDVIERDGNYRPVLSGVSIRVDKDRMSTPQAISIPEGMVGAHNRQRIIFESPSSFSPGSLPGLAGKGFSKMGSQDTLVGVWNQEEQNSKSSNHGKSPLSPKQYRKQLNFISGDPKASSLHPYTAFGARRKNVGLNPIVIPPTAIVTSTNVGVGGDSIDSNTSNSVTHSPTSQQSS